MEPDLQFSQKKKLNLTWERKNAEMKNRMINVLATTSKKRKK